MLRIPYALASRYPGQVTISNKNMQIKFAIQNMEGEHASFLVEKIAPAFGMEIVEQKVSKQKAFYTLEGHPSNAQSFERYLRMEVLNNHGLYQER